MITKYDIDDYKYKNRFKNIRQLIVYIKDTLNI